MRRKNEDNENKKKILLESFKLFASKPFGEVSYSEIQKATGLSRGAILYHVQSKENLFNLVLHKLIFERNSISQFDTHQKLWDNIVAYIEEREREQNEFKEMGIENINKAFINIECAGFYFQEKMHDLAVKWITSELNFWNKLIKRAIDNNEIVDNIDIDKEARLFLNVFLGASYVGIGLPLGYDLKLLKEDFRYLYDKIKL